jgi:hypothetical protein
MLQAHIQSAACLIVIAPWFGLFDGLFEPMYLLVIGIIAILLFGKRLPDMARFLGRKLVEHRFRKDFGSRRRRGDDEEPGGCPARLEPPDKPRPPAAVALTPPKSSED